jgi:hypothetical protein
MFPQGHQSDIDAWETFRAKCPRSDNVYQYIHEQNAGDFYVPLLDELFGEDITLATEDPLNFFLGDSESRLGVEEGADVEEWVSTDSVVWSNRGERLPYVPTRLNLGPRRGASDAELIARGQAIRIRQQLSPLTREQYSSKSTVELRTIITVRGIRGNFTKHKKEQLVEVLLADDIENPNRLNDFIAARTAQVRSVATSSSSELNVASATLVESLNLGSCDDNF